MGSSWQWVKEKGAADDQAWAICKGREKVDRGEGPFKYICKPSEKMEVPCDSKWHTLTLGSFVLRMSGGTERPLEKERNLEASPCRVVTPDYSANTRNKPDEWFATFKQKETAYTFTRQHDLDLGYRMSHWVGEPFKREYENTDRREDEPIADAEEAYGGESLPDPVSCEDDPNTGMPCVLHRNRNRERNSEQTWDPEKLAEKPNKTDGWIIQTAPTATESSWMNKQYRANVCIRAQFRCTPTPTDRSLRKSSELLLWTWPRSPGEAPIPWRSRGPNWVVLDFGRRAPNPLWSEGSRAWDTPLDMPTRLPHRNAPQFKDCRCGEAAKQSTGTACRCGTASDGAPLAAMWGPVEAGRRISERGPAFESGPS